MKKLGYIWLFFSINAMIYSQQVAWIDHFELYELENDTLHFNQNAYEFVRTVEKQEEGGYTIYLYDLTTLYEFENNIIYSPYKVQALKKGPKDGRFFTYYGTYSERLYKMHYWDNQKTSDRKTFHIIENKQAIYQNLEASIRLPGIEKKDPTREFRLYSYLFPMLREVMDSFKLYLHIEPYQKYFITLSCNDSVNVKVVTTEVCNPANNSAKPILSTKELENELQRLLSKVKMPVFAIQHKVFPYYISYEIDIDDYISAQIKNDIRSNFQSSTLAFEKNDSLRVIIDPFNNKTIFYLPNSFDPRKSESWVYSYDGILDIIQNLIDINQDGYLDLVLDTVIKSNYSSGGGYQYEISYIPNYKIPGNYGPDIRESLFYTKDLGNQYYYDLGYEAGRIFYLDNNQEKDIIAFKMKYFFNKNKTRRDLLWSFYVQNNTSLTKALKLRHKEVEGMIEKLTQLIQYYVEHPEKLPVDFPMK